MRVMIYLTTGADAKRTAPVLYVEDRPGAALPEHPKALRWSYFATVDGNDPLLAREQQQLRAAFANGAPYVSELLPLGL
jgi:hypothetical protein